MVYILILVKLGFLWLNARFKFLQQKLNISAHFLGIAYLYKALFRINGGLTGQAIVCFQDELDKVYAFRIDTQDCF